MRFQELRYMLQAARENVRGHWTFHLVTSAAVAFSLLLIAVFLLILNNLQAIAERWGRELQITVYLEEGMPEGGRVDLEETIRRWQEVESVSYVSPSQALENLKAALGESAQVLDGLRENPLPGSLEVRLKKPFRSLEAIEEVASRCRALKGAAEVDYGGAWIGRFFSLLYVMRWVGITLGFLLLFGTVVVISSTLTMGFYARKDEIEILRLVGATETFVRVPFFLEALLQGIGGAAAAVAMCWGLYAVFRLRLGASWTNFAGWSQPVFLDPASILSILLLGLALGVLGSILTFARFSRSPG